MSDRVTHTILGSSGVIGRETALALSVAGKQVRLVARNPQKYNPSDELSSANLLDPEQVMKAVTGSEVVYLTVGLIYKLSVWQEEWPRIMQSTILACEANEAKLVFFDNVYAYGKVKGWMTETTPVHPCSKKGEVRAKIVRMLMDEVEKGKLKALIARAVDFYGPFNKNSVPNMLVIDNLIKGKKAQWLLNANVKHSLTFTPDAGQATALLGQTNDAFNQIWHLPTHADALTGKEFIEHVAAVLGVAARFTTLPMWQLKLGGLFQTVIKETIEMGYQNSDEYLFDSSKFTHRFNFTPTEYNTGIALTVKSEKNN